MSEWWSTTQLACRNPSICLTPLPTLRGNPLQPFPQIHDGHWINLDADILGEETRQSLQKPPFEIAVNVLKCSNHQGNTCDETYRSLRMAVYESRHVVELGPAKKQHVAAGGEKGIDATKQVRNLRSWLFRNGRSNCQAKETGRRRSAFAKVSQQLLNCRIQ